MERLRKWLVAPLGPWPSWRGCSLRVYHAPHGALCFRLLRRQAASLDPKEVCSHGEWGTCYCPQVGELNASRDSGVAVALETRDIVQERNARSRGYYCLCWGQCVKRQDVFLREPLGWEHRSVSISGWESEFESPKPI